MSSENERLLKEPEESQRPLSLDPEVNLEAAVQDVYEAIDEDIDEDELDEDAVWLREQRHLNKSLHWLKRPSVYMVGLLLFCISLSEGEGESSKRVIMFKLACNALMRDTNREFCDPSETEIIVSNLQMVTTICVGITGLFAVSKVGKLSDQHGRKPFFIAVCVSNLVGKIFKYWVMTDSPYLQFGLMVFSEILGNLAGGLMAFISLCNCYVSDISDAHQRTYYLGLAMAFLYVGISLGPVLGNFVLIASQKVSSPDNSKSVNSEVLIERHEFVPLMVQIVILGLATAGSIFVLPESRSDKAIKKSRSMSTISVDAQALAEVQEANKSVLVRTVAYVASVGNVLRPLRLLYIPKEFKPSTYTDARFMKDRISVLFMVIGDCVLTGLAIGLSEVLFLYGILEFEWNQFQIGNAMAVSCASKATVLILLSPLIQKLLIKRFKFTHIKTQFDMIDFFNSFVGMAIEGFGIMLIAFAQNSTQVYVFAAIGSFGSLASPALNSSIVKYYPESKIGELFAAISLIKNCMMLLAPTVLLSIYKKSISSWNRPGFVFLCGGGALVVASFLMIIVKAILNLNVNSRPEAVSRRGSSVRSRSNSISDSQAGPEEPQRSASIVELHRKNSNISHYRN